MLIVEVGFELKNNLNYYDNLLRKNGLTNDFNVVTHDIYYTNKNLDGLSENQMKNSCMRLRSCNNEDYQIQNNLISGLKSTQVKRKDLREFENKLFELGYRKVLKIDKKVPKIA